MAEVEQPDGRGRVDGYGICEAPARQAGRTVHGAGGDPAVAQGELAWLPPAGRYIPAAVDVTGRQPVLPADATAGELLVTRSPSPDGGHVATLWLCVRGCGSGYTPGDPAYWAEVLLGPRFPGTGASPADPGGRIEGSPGS